MTVDECNARACECAANAGQSQTPAITLEFLTLSAQWRAMAVRDIFLGHLGPRIDALAALNALPMLADHSA